MSSDAGVLTFHRCINYGSYWQARCLVEGLRALGVDAVLMDYRSARVDRAEWRCALSPVPSAPRSSDDRHRYRRKIQRFFDAIERLPTTAPFDLDQPEQASSFRSVIIGSDEVWNLRHPWYGGQSVFYGDGLRGRLVSYAASFGNQGAEEGLEPSWASRLQAFSAISVRDENSRRMIEAALKVEPELALDPCLQFPEVIFGAAEGGEYAPPFVAVYGHSFPAWFAMAARDWAEGAGLRLISIGYRNDWAHEQWIEAGPLGFATFMRRASAVLTNFFHGCVFSLVFEKPFVCAPSAYRNNKLRDLLSLIDASERLLGPETAEAAMEQLLDAPARAGTYARIAALHGRSSGYLDHVLD